MTDLPKPIDFKSLPLKKRRAMQKEVGFRREIDETVKEKDREVNKLKLLRKKVEEKIMSVFHRGEGGVHSTTIDGYEVYAKKDAVYSLKPDIGRSRLDDWVLHPLIEAEVPHEVIQEVMLRLAIFKNDPVKSAVEEYRMETGGKLVPINKDTSILVGGNLPKGVRMSHRTGLGFRKAKSS